MKKALKLILLFLLILSLSACAGREIVPLPVADDYDVVAGATPSGMLRVGLIPGVYSDMFTEAIQPSLEGMGYTIEIILFDNPTSLNDALVQNQIDLNMYQDYKALNTYKFANDVALSAIAEVPTSNMAIFSSKYETLRDIENHAKVSMPIESAEVSRALAVLENAGLISLSPSADRNSAGFGDIDSNPYNLNFNPFRAENITNSFLSSALLVIDSSVTLNEELEFPEAIYENTGADNLTVIAVRTGDLHAQFVSDIIGVVNSDEYKSVIEDPNGAFVHFQRPRSFYEQNEEQE